MILIDDIYKSFGLQNVLCGVSLSIESGEMLAIVGPSGTGKSVLLKIVTGLLAPDRGRVIIHGKPVRLIEKFQLGQTYGPRLGVLFQNAALFDSLTVYDNIAFPLRHHLRLSESEVYTRTSRCLSQVELTQYSLALPGEISIGMRKRVGIARALVVEPEILLFDEPNTGLDPETGQEIYDLIRDTHKEFRFTGIVISHEIPEVFQVCSRVAMLYEGKVQHDGTIPEFTNSENPVVRQFVRGESEGPIQLV